MFLFSGVRKTPPELRFQIFLICIWKKKRSICKQGSWELHRSDDWMRYTFAKAETNVFGFENRLFSHSSWKTRFDWIINFVNEPTVGIAPVITVSRKNFWIIRLSAIISVIIEKALSFFINFHRCARPLQTRASTTVISFVYPQLPMLKSNFSAKWLKHAINIIRLPTLPILMYGKYSVPNENIYNAGEKEGTVDSVRAGFSQKVQLLWQTKIRKVIFGFGCSPFDQKLLPMRQMKVSAIFI